MSPESLIYNKMSKESDVWSYGVLLWEIFTLGCTPYPSFSNEELLERLKSGYRMPRPALCNSAVYEQTMLACWNEDPKQRPAFGSLASFLDQYRQQQHSRPGSLERLVNGCDDEDANCGVEFIDQSDSQRPVLNEPRLVVSSESSFNKSNSVSTNTTSYTTTSHQSSSTSSSSASSIVFYEKHDRDLFQIR